MKKMTTLLILLTICSTLIAPPLGQLIIIASTPIKPWEKVWNVTCKIESNNDSTAVGDKHLKRWSHGIAMIRQSRLDDFNKRTGKNYTIKDVYDTIIAKEIFMFYAHGDNEVTAREWNGGPDGMIKKSTIEYWNKIKEHL
jgi:hypothetical protein